MNKTISVDRSFNPGRPRGHLLVLATGFACLLACRKTPPAPVEPATSPIAAPATAGSFREFIKTKGLSPEQEKAALQNADDMERAIDQDALDKKELVSPAPPGFKPEAARRKIRLTIVLEKPMIRRGAAPRLRVEMTNVGSESLRIGEIHGSFFKFGVLSMSRDMKFLLTPPDGKEINLYTAALGSGSPREIEFPSDWSEARKSRAAEEMNRRAKSGSALSVELLPGETLRTRGDAAGDPFRTLAAQVDFSALGSYRIRVKYDDRRAPPTERYIQEMAELAKKSGRGIYATRAEIEKDHQRWAAAALGPAESNEAHFEVVP